MSIEVPDTAAASPLPRLLSLSPSTAVSSTASQNGMCKEGWQGKSYQLSWEKCVAAAAAAASTSISSWPNKFDLQVQRK